MRILVVEDDQDLAATIAQGLRAQAMAVDVAIDGEEALDRIAINDYAVVVPDRDLPKVHGDDVCRTLAAKGASARVQMLTAAAGLEHRVEGLRIGADDYLPKPFDFAELVARIQALARRPASRRAPVLTSGELTLDVAARRAERRNTEVSLTTKEFTLLQVLMGGGRRRRQCRGASRASMGRERRARSAPEGPGNDRLRG